MICCAWIARPETLPEPEPSRRTTQDERQLRAHVCCGSLATTCLSQRCQVLRALHERHPELLCCAVPACCFSVRGGNQEDSWRSDVHCVRRYAVHAAVAHTPESCGGGCCEHLVHSMYQQTLRTFQSFDVLCLDCTARDTA